MSEGRLPSSLKQGVKQVTGERRAARPHTAAGWKDVFLGRAAALPHSVVRQEKVWAHGSYQKGIRNHESWPDYPFRAKPQAEL